MAKKLLVFPYKLISRETVEEQIDEYKKDDLYKEDDEIVYPLTSDLVNYSFLQEENGAVISEMSKKLHSVGEIVVFCEAGCDALVDVFTAIGIRYGIPVREFMSGNRIAGISIKMKKGDK